MSKQVFFSGVAVYALTVAFLLTDQLLWEPGVSQASVRRIRPGMTLAEVEAILGGPSDSASRAKRIIELAERLLARMGKETKASMDCGEFVVSGGTVMSRPAGLVEEATVAIFHVWEGARGSVTVQF